MELCLQVSFLWYLTFYSTTLLVQDLSSHRSNCVQLQRACDNCEVLLFNNEMNSHVCAPLETRLKNEVQANAMLRKKVAELSNILEEDADRSLVRKLRNQLGASEEKFLKLESREVAKDKVLEDLVADYRGA